MAQEREMIKIKKVEGCTAYSFTVNDKEFDELSMKEKKGLIENILDNIIRYRGLDGAAHALLEHLEYDEYKVNKPCDQCGDTVQTSYYTLNERS